MLTHQSQLVIQTVSLLTALPLYSLPAGASKTTHEAPRLVLFRSFATTRPGCSALLPSRRTTLKTGGQRCGSGQQLVVAFFSY